MTFASRLTNARIKAGFTVAQAAKFCRVSNRAWRYWEAGEKTPPAKPTDVITQGSLLNRMKEASK